MIKPLNDYIIVRPLKGDEMTKSGFYVPDSAQSNTPESGEVVAVGEEVKNIKEGENIFFRKYAPDEITFDDEQYLVVSYKDVIGKYGKTN